jgi:hypothetical protein
MDHFTNKGVIQECELTANISDDISGWELTVKIYNVICPIITNLQLR